MRFMADFRALQKPGKLALAVLLLAMSAARAAPECNPPFVFGAADPASEQVDPRKLLELTRQIRTQNAAILSFAISRHGKLVYELYSSKVDRNAAHYLMSVTKSVTSALAGIAVDRHLISGASAKISDSLPTSDFGTPQNQKRFDSVTIRDVLAMSALDAQVFPTMNTAEAASRSKQFVASRNRLSLALQQKLLPNIGSDFQYTDITPMIIGGILQRATRARLFEFAETSLFGPMGFRNEEWMHRDPSSFDNPSYGLRLRPVDMQKFGLLYLNRGCWEGRRLLSSEWISASFTPWIKTDRTEREPNYGWYWWRARPAPHWEGVTANGWKGQRISVFPEKGVVVTMTGAIEDGSEERVYADLLARFVIPAIDSYAPGRPADPTTDRELKAALTDVWLHKNALRPDTEARMVPSVSSKERR
jgi:CubicO group peptidase (beta-lactamase class C family)